MGVGSEEEKGRDECRNGSPGHLLATCWLTTDRMRCPQVGSENARQRMNSIPRYQERDYRTKAR